MTPETLKCIIECVIKYEHFEIGSAYAIASLFKEDIAAIKESRSTINSIRLEIGKAEENHDINRAAMLKYGALAQVQQTLEAWEEEIKLKFLNFLKEKKVILEDVQLWIVNAEQAKIIKALNQDINTTNIKHQNDENIEKNKTFKVQVYFDKSCAEEITIKLTRIPRIGEIITINQKSVTIRGKKIECNLFLVKSVNHWVDDSDDGIVGNIIVKPV